MPGALLAAAYMLRLTQKMAWGAPANAATWKDLNKREWLYLLPLAFFVLYIGLAPTPLFKVMDPSLKTVTARLQTEPTAVAGHSGPQSNEASAKRAILLTDAKPAQSRAGSDKRWISEPELILSEGYQLLLVALLFIQSLDQRLQKPAVRCWLPTMAGLGVVPGPL